MKIEDVKIGMKVVYADKISIVENKLKNYIYLSNIDEIVFPQEITPYIETKQSKRIPLSEMPQDEFEELIRLGYDVEYKKCVPDVMKMGNNMVMISYDDWETGKLTIKQI